MDNRPVGIFDSGFGGLTALKALREMMPDENIIYFGDNGRAPYGGRGAEQLKAMARQDIAFVSGLGVKAMIVACGTLSSAAADVLEECSLPLSGVLNASVNVLQQLGGSSPLGIIATEASIKSGAFKSALHAAFPEREIIDLACPEFVPLIESGHISADDPLLTAAVERALAPLKARQPGTLLLGCTHYGIVGDAISAYLGRDVRLVSASECAASEMRDRLVSSGMTGGEGRTRYLTSGSAEDFSKVASVILGMDGIRAEHIPPMEVEYI